MDGGIGTEMIYKMVRIVAAIALLLVATTLVLAQKDKNKVARMEIRVADPSNAVFPDAELKLRPAGSTLPRLPMFSSQAGTFSSEVEPGTYDLLITRAGFQAHAERIELREGVNPRKEIVLGALPHYSIVRVDSPGPLDIESHTPAKPPIRFG